MSWSQHRAPLPPCSKAKHVVGFQGERDIPEWERDHTEREWVWRAGLQDKESGDSSSQGKKKLRQPLPEEESSSTEGKEDSRFSNSCSAQPHLHLI